MFFVFKRKTALLYISSIIIFLSFLSGYAKYTSMEYPQFDGVNIIIDPGHGGIDGGAVGKNGTLEKELNLSLSNALAQKLKSKGFNVIMTRTEDKLIYEEKDSGNKKRADTKNRLNIAKNNPDALFISIHMNYFDDSTVRGSQIFYSLKNPESKIFADILKESIRKHADNKNNRENKEAYPSIYIMKNIKNTAVLIECGFISNREEEKLLSSSEYRNKLADGICEAVILYKNQRSLPISQV